MKYNLSIKNNQYCLEIIENIDNKKRINRIYDQTKIFDIISEFREYADSVVEYNDNMKFIFEDRIITLMEFEKHKDKNLYSFIHDSINENTRIIKKVEHINKKKILAMALTGAAIVTLTISGVAAFGSEDKMEPVQITAEVPTTPTPIDVPTNTPKPTVTPTPIIAIEPTITATSTPLPTSTPTPTVTPIPENISRLLETNKIRNNEISNNDIIPIATKLSDNSLQRITDFFQTDGWNYAEKYSSDFGEDPYLLSSIGYAESNLLHEKTLPGGSGYNGFAVGRFQHETPDKEWNITAYNYNTNEWETVRMCMENAVDEEMNTKMAAMILQNRLYEFNNNIYLTIQSYNYGVKAMNMIISKYAEEINCTEEEVKNNYTDIGWMKYVEDFHYNPQNYIKWDYKTYGDKDYVKKVLGYYIGTETTNYDKEGNLVTINLLDMSNSYGTISR